MVSQPWLVLCHCFKQWRQKLCKHGRCFGSVNMSEHTEQDTSSRRLWSSVLISMSFSRNSTRNNLVLWLSLLASLGCGCLSYFGLFKPIMGRCFKSLFRCVLNTDSWECDPEALRFSSFIRCHSKTDQNKTLVLQSPWYNEVQRFDIHVVFRNKKGLAELSRSMGTKFRKEGTRLRDTNVS